MFDSQVIDVGIGLVLMFFLLALTASSIVEAIAGIFKIRAKKLENAICQLISDPDDVQKTVDVWSTSVFGALKAGTRAKSVKPGTPSKKTRGPSYVSARAFADATIEGISALKKDLQTGREVAAKLPPNLKTRLDAITNEVGTDLQGLKAGLEQWFDETMERTSGAFKRWSQIALFFIALGLAVGLNASTTRVASTLWNQSTVRDAIVQAARNVTADKSANETSTDIDKIGEKVRSLKSLGFPVGWQRWDSAAGPVGTVVGWFITAFLVLLGAPFWYGLLTKLVSLRSAGNKPPPAGLDPASATTAVKASPMQAATSVPLESALDAIPALST